MMIKIFRNLCGKFIECWRQADNKKRLWMYIGVYTMIFLGAFLLAYSPLLWHGKTFVSMGDARQSHLPILIYIGRYLRRIFLSFINGVPAVPFYDISIGEGDDIIGFLSSSGVTDPLYLLSAFVPMRYSEWLYAFLAVFRVYLAGLSFSYLCFYFRKRAIHTLIGSLVYCFCAYPLFTALWHPYFINPMISLPLLVVGLDKVLKKGAPYFFVFTMAYATLCGFGHLYIMTIMLFIYAVVRFFDLYRENRIKEFIFAVYRGSVSYLFGIGLAAVFFLPQIAQFLQSARSGFINFGVAAPYNIDRFFRVIAPPAWSWDEMTFVAIALFAVSLLFFSKGKRTLKCLVFLAFMFYIFPLGGLIMNGFQYASQRWSFGMALVVSYAVVEMLPELLALSHRNRQICIAVFGSFTAACLLVKRGQMVNHAVGVTVGVVFLTLTLLVLVLPMCSKEAKTDTEIDDGRGSALCRAVICLGLVLLNVAANGVCSFAGGKGLGGRKNWYTSWGVETALLYGARERDLEAHLSKNPSGRMDGGNRLPDSLYSNMVWQIPGMFFYSPTYSGNVIDFWQATEACGGEMNFLLQSTDQRTIINTLLSGKYQVEPKNRIQYIPYGYKQIKAARNLIYENEYALPWGYTYDKVISFPQLNALSGLKKQEAMLQTIALDEEIQLPDNESVVIFDNERLAYDIAFRDCTWRNGELIVYRENATITLKCNIPGGAEGYVHISGLVNPPNLERFRTVVGCGSVAKGFWSFSPLYKYYYGKANHLVNVGYNEKERHSITITFPRPGTFKLKDIELYALPFTNYPARVNALRAEPLKNIKWGTNELTGTVDLTKDKILCVSVPYSKGWSATVDGKEEKILRGNYMFMALPLKAGHHDIVFSYCPPGLKIGAALTVLSWGILAWMLIRERRRA